MTFYSWGSPGQFEIYFAGRNEAQSAQVVAYSAGHVVAHIVAKAVAEIVVQTVAYFVAKALAESVVQNE